MPSLSRRSWVPEASENYVQGLAKFAATQPAEKISGEISQLTALNRRIYELECFNLNPAGNAMNPRAEAFLAEGLGSRPSLGYPGDKYEMGLEAVEQIEAITAELCAEIFQAKYAEIRVASGAMANLYAFMATCKAGDAIIVPPASIGGHVTHQMAGAAGLYGLDIHEAPVDAANFTVDLEGLRKLARRLKPKLITIGGSLNLFAHPVKEVRAIADEVGALVMFDAAHLCGMIAGKAWANPLLEGAHLMTMSTYKSLGGPAGGLIVTNDAGLAQRLDAIAYPGMTANFDVAKSAALALTLLDWREHGQDYAKAMIRVAKALAQELDRNGVPVFSGAGGFTTSHQFAVKAERFGGGQTASKKLRKANLLVSGIGLPIPTVAGDLNGIRFGTPEIVRWGVDEKDAAQLAGFIAKALTSNDPASLAPEVSQFRAKFNELHYIIQA
ncbi:MAG TPA: aminotransferase class I/II-fold pyridoxal phosphate-dependent enzyme [Aestuariivirga sp.]|nr:aminotransferase class I/II-fold pyridoxal phosphate-dependent enzyme [Aestuariivirga sp.]